MYTLLLVALLLALLFDTAAATAIAPTLPAAPMEFPYPDPEHMLDAICELCHVSVDICMHSVETFLEHPEWPQDVPLFTDVARNLSEPTGLFTAPDSLDSGVDSDFASSIDSSVYFTQNVSPPPSSFAGEFERNPSGPIDPSVDSDFSTHNLAGHTQWLTVTEADRQPLRDACVQQFNRETATTVQPSTIHNHLQDTYNVGDRIEQAVLLARPSSNKRQAPRPGGFPCPYEGCVKAFDRKCDVNRHIKTHLDRSKRPHRCSDCEEGFLYPKDLVRHKTKHTAAQGTLFCLFPGCSSEGFSRRDNLLRHQRKQHPTAVASS